MPFMNHCWRPCSTCRLCSVPNISIQCAYAAPDSHNKEGFITKSYKQGGRKHDILYLVLRCVLLPNSACIESFADWKCIWALHLRLRLKTQCILHADLSWLLNCFNNTIMNTSFHLLKVICILIWNMNVRCYRFPSGVSVNFDSSNTLAGLMQTESGNGIVCISTIFPKSICII